MDYQQLINSMTPDIYQRLKRAVEIGSWPDGRRLTPEQRETSLQAIIWWGEQHLAEQDRVGFIDRKHKANDSCDTPVETPLKWQE